MFRSRFASTVARRSIVFAFVALTTLIAVLVPTFRRVHSQQKSAGPPITTDITVIPPGSAYRVTHLFSDIPGFAVLQDPLLVNPWGISSTATSPLWVSNQGTNTSTLYKGDVAGSPFVKNTGLAGITIPGSPTGTVANSGGPTDFVITNGASGRAAFLFATLGGTIVGWNPNVPAAGSTQGTTAATHAGSVYTGLAIANNGTANFLYAADFKNGAIDVYSSTFGLQPAASFPFIDATIPTTPGNVYHPYNIQNLGGSLYVTYAKVGADGRAEAGAGNGYVRKYNTNGVRDLTFGINNGKLNAPWGLVLSPASFGILHDQLLVGNFGEGGGSINAYTPSTGAFQGTLLDESGAEIEIDELWALVNGNGGNGGDPNTIYFSAGTAEEIHGLLGSIKPTTASATSLIQFATDDITINENNSFVDITVTRAGDVSSTATVSFNTLDEEAAGHANQKSDYIINAGSLTFNPGETSKIFRILLEDDLLVEGDEVIDIALSNPKGAGVGLGTPNTAKITIHDNDVTTPTTNPLEDNNFFVRQQYLDFLNREPDPGGQAFWVNEIAQCGSDQVCISNRRISVSAAFFLETEFQRTGFLIHRMFRSAFGRSPLYGEYIVSRNQLGQGSDAEKTAFANAFVQRPDFIDKYNALSNAAYVDALLANVGVGPTQTKLFSTTLTGAQEVPPNNSTATGSSTLLLSADELTAKVSLSFSGLSSPQTAAHIHGPADPGVNAPVIFPLPNGQVTDFTINLTSGQLADLKAGKLYVNVHSNNFMDGEIRGQYPSTSSFRDTLVAGLDNMTETRASVLLKVAESAEVRQKELNLAFVVAEYFGYLRRDPDPGGLNFWLGQLNSTTPPNFRAMVCAFLTSAEYQQRFGTAVRSNSECASITPGGGGSNH
jgi:uncharacterized protein (TIGR03118 family)